MRWLLDPVLGNEHPLILYYGSLAISAWYGGWWPALLALGSGYLAADWFFLPPRYDFIIFRLLPTDLAGLGVYLFTGLVISSFSEAAKRAQHRAELSAWLAKNREESLNLEVTERSRAEGELRRSQERLQLALEAAHMVTWEWDRMRDETIFSKNVGKVMGIDSPSKAQNSKSWWNWVHPGDLWRHKRTMLKAFVKRDSYVSQFRLFRPDNGILEWLEDHARGIVNAAGKLTGATGVVMDITERKQAEQEIEEGKRQLERRVRERTAELFAANKELEAFSYSVSHDLRSPLRSIMGSVELLAEQGKGRLDGESEELLGLVVQKARRMNELITDLLSLSRVSRTEMRCGTVCLSELVQRIAADIRATEADRAAEFIIAPEVKVHGDERLLRVALENLLNNAWKFSRQSSMARIEFGIEQLHGQAVFFVRDNGAGFDMAYADKLFVPFQRLHSESDFPGTGIGLVTVQRIISRHGGRIWAEGVVDKGATFYFTLPNQTEVASSHILPTFNGR